MPYSIMLWLVNPGAQAHEAQALHMLNQNRSAFPGAHGGVNEPPAACRLTYGLFDNAHQAKEALEHIEKHLSKNQPIPVKLGNGTTFLVPAARVHYAVLSEIERPIDSPEKQLELGYVP